MANGTLAASQIEMLSQSGTGIYTIVPPATNTNRTLTLPDTSGTLLDSTGATTLTNLTVTNGASIQGLTVGRGAGAGVARDNPRAAALARGAPGAGVGRRAERDPGNNGRACAPRPLRRYLWLDAGGHQARRLRGQPGVRDHAGDLGASAGWARHAARADRRRLVAAYEEKPRFRMRAPIPASRPRKAR